MNKAKKSRYILPEGNVNMNLVSQLTGTFTAPLVLKVWEQSGHNESTIDALFLKLERLFNDGREAEFMEEIKLLCGILGHDYADEIAIATQNEQVRNGFIISFLSDFDDALLDLA